MNIEKLNSLKKKIIINITIVLAFSITVKLVSLVGSLSLTSKYMTRQLKLQPLSVDQIFFNIYIELEHH